MWIPEQQVQEVTDKEIKHAPVLGLTSKTSMTKRLGELLKALKLFAFDGDYIERLDHLTRQLRSCADAQLAIEPVLRFIEAHPNDDLGAPGPLVHFAEEFYKNAYEPELLKSIGRKATPLNVWMLNRLINGADGAEREGYVAGMRRVARDSTVSKDARALASEFLTYLV